MPAINADHVALPRIPDPRPTATDGPVAEAKLLPTRGWPALPVRRLRGR